MRKFLVVMMVCASPLAHAADMTDFESDQHQVRESYEAERCKSRYSNCEAQEAKDLEYKAGVKYVEEIRACMEAKTVEKCDDKRCKQCLKKASASADTFARDAWDRLQNICPPPPDQNVSIAPPVTPKPEKKPEKKKPAPTPAVALKPGDVTVWINNSSGVAGDAKKVAKLIQKKMGYSPAQTTVDPAKGPPRDTTAIQAKAKGAVDAAKIKLFMEQEGYVVDETVSPLQDNEGGYDISITLGKNRKGSAPPAPPGPVAVVTPAPAPAPAPTPAPPVIIKVEEKPEEKPVEKKPEPVVEKKPEEKKPEPKPEVKPEPKPEEKKPEPAPVPVKVAEKPAEESFLHKYRRQLGRLTNTFGLGLYVGGHALFSVPDLQLTPVMKVGPDFRLMMDFDYGSFTLNGGPYLNASYASSVFKSTSQSTTLPMGGGFQTSAELLGYPLLLSPGLREACEKDKNILGGCFADKFGIGGYASAEVGQNLPRISNAALSGKLWEQQRVTGSAGLALRFDLTDWTGVVIHLGPTLGMKYQAQGAWEHYQMGPVTGLRIFPEFGLMFNVTPYFRGPNMEEKFGKE